MDGSVYSAMLGLTQDYVVPFALALKATVLQVGLLSSIPKSWGKLLESPQTTFSVVTRGAAQYQWLSLLETLSISYQRMTI